MRRYEVLYILRPDIPQENYAAAVSKFEKAVIENGGEVKNVDEWGLKPFAYELNHYNQGYYVLMGFETLASKLGKLEERFKLDETVLRYQIVKVEE